MAASFFETKGYASEMYIAFSKNRRSRKIARGPGGWGLNTAELKKIARGHAG